MSSLVSLIVASLNSFTKITISHSWAVKSSTISDLYVANNILNGYIRYHKLEQAHKLFDEMSQRDTISWNTMITGYVKLENFEGALETMKTMKRLGFELDGHTFGSALKGIALARQSSLGRSLHSVVIKSGYSENVFANSALLDMYSKCGSVEEAFGVFERMSDRNNVSWNAMISCFVRGRDRVSVFELLSRMESEFVDEGTIAPILTLLDEAGLYRTAAQVHCKAVRTGLISDNKVCNAMITSYSECESISDAKRVFDCCKESRDLVTWNSMIGAYLSHGKKLRAFELFTDMQRLGFVPDIYSYTSIISAFFEKGLGKSLHGLVIKRGLESSSAVSNSLMAMYLKVNNRSVDKAMKVFESMDVKDRVSWNSILTGLSQSGLSEEALRFFVVMRREVSDVDHYTFSAALRSCADLATLQLGREIHVLALKLGLETNEFVASALIFMYSKCGIIKDARKSFEEEDSKQSSIAWNSMIFAYAQHGLGFIALKIFSQMKQNQVKLDYITFVAVLTACSHVGLVDKGLKLLQSMESEHGINPRTEHYACAVDLLGRAGSLEEARKLVESMPFEPDSMVLKTLLGACRACGNVELASQVATHLLSVDPEDHCTYVLLSDIYGNLGLWNERAGVKRLMRQRGVRKVPGWSWIEIDNRVHAFKAEDRSKSRCDEIYFVLEVLMYEIRRIDCVVVDGDDDDDFDVLIRDFDDLNESCCTS